jgi:hypothetical protein
MNRIIFVITILIFNLNLYGQSDIEVYKDLMDIDEEIVVKKINLEQMKNHDLSNLWMIERQESIHGFIGKKYRRLRIRFISVIKDMNNPTDYLVYGKTKVNNNLCEFQGKIKIDNSFAISDNSKYGVLVGRYKFFENSSLEHSGCFEGRFATFWYIDANEKVQYNDKWSVSAMYNNNQFAGSWTDYITNNKLVANWGESRILISGDLDVGTSEFIPDEKYRKNGWETFLKSDSVEKGKWW